MRNVLLFKSKVDEAIVDQVIELLPCTTYMIAETYIYITQEGIDILRHDGIRFTNMTLCYILE